MEEKSPLYITDEQIAKVLKALDNDEETALMEAMKTLLIVTADTRRFLRHINKELKKGCSCQKVYTQPTGNKEDIIAGKYKPIEDEMIKDVF